MKAAQSETESSLRSKDLVIFEILRDSKCTGCGKVICKGELLFLDGERALCLSCADFDHLEYLPRGDAALTRRAKKYSGLSAVVVRFSRSRGRYERQGILVEVSALERAEKECQADAQRRAALRSSDSVGACVRHHFEAVRGAQLRGQHFVPHTLFEGERWRRCRSLGSRTRYERVRQSSAAEASCACGGNRRIEKLACGRTHGQPQRGLFKSIFESHTSLDFMVSSQVTSRPV